jgi:ubiquitin carboxyl-terminal hydrolase 8
MNKYSDGLSGLVNIGNTCYMNAAIQCLSNTTMLTEYFLTKEYLKDIVRTKKEASMCIEYYKLLNGLWEENCVIKPLSFKKVLGELELKFNNFFQHDSQEVLSLLINILHISLSYEVDIKYEGNSKNELDNMQIKSIKTWSKHFKKQYSKILEIFYGQFQSKLICEKCNKYSNNFDPFCLIALPINNNMNNIYQCFDEFTSIEKLDNQNKWKCKYCKEHCNAIKQISIWKIPNILIIVLKRFNHETGEKINLDINFPIDNLNLSKYINGYDKYDAKYEAYGIINHVGNIGYGHYYAYCKNIDGEWYNYDDSHISKLKNIITENAYVLFYKKKNIG